MQSVRIDMALAQCRIVTMNNRGVNDPREPCVLSLCSPKSSNNFKKLGHRVMRAFEVLKNTAAWRVPRSCRRRFGSYFPGAVFVKAVNNLHSVYVFPSGCLCTCVCICVRAYELPRICGFSENLEYSVVCCARQRSSKSFATLRYLGQHDIKTFTAMQLRRILSSCASNLS